MPFDFSLLLAIASIMAAPITALILAHRRRMSKTDSKPRRERPANWLVVATRRGKFIRLAPRPARSPASGHEPPDERTGKFRSKELAALVVVLGVIIAATAIFVLSHREAPGAVTVAFSDTDRKLLKDIGTAMRSDPVAPVVSYTLTKDGFSFFGNGALSLFFALISISLSAAGARRRRDGAQHDAGIQTAADKIKTATVEKLGFFRRAWRWYVAFNDGAMELISHLSLLTTIFSLVFGSFSVWDGVKIFDRGLSLFEEKVEETANPVAPKRKTGAPLRVQLEVVDGSTGVPLDCGNGGNSPAMRKIGPFAVPQGSNEQPRLEHGDLDVRVAAVLAELRSHYGLSHHVRQIVLIGSADIRDTLPPPNGRLGTNRSIALRRAERVERSIEAQWVGDRPPTILVTIRDAEIAAARADALESDRSVEVCIRWD